MTRAALPRGGPHRTRLATCALAALLAAPAFAQDKAAPPTVPPGETRQEAAVTPARVLEKLHATNLLEVKAGRLAARRGQSRGVRDYGNMLARDHEKADKALRGQATRLHVDLGDKPADLQDRASAKSGEAKVAALASMRGPAFDRAFAGAMQSGHAEAIAFVERARGELKDPALMALLDKTLPTLEHHRDVAAKLGQAAGADDPGKDDRADDAGKDDGPGKDARPDKAGATPDESKPEPRPQPKNQ